MTCSFGVAPSSLVVVVPTILAQTRPAANLMDHIPIANIPAYGMCQSLVNGGSSDVCRARGTYPFMCMLSLRRRDPVHNARNHQNLLA